MNFNYFLTAAFALLTLSVSAQNISKEKFDELWNRADSAQKVIMRTGNVTKDLNALEKEKIETVDPKKQTVTNPNYKKIDTTNLEELSTQPIVKGAKTKTSVKPAEKPKTEKPAAVPVKPEVKPNAEAKPKADVKPKPEIQQPKKEATAIPKKDTIEDFSTQPIVKGKKPVVKETVKETVKAAAPSKPKMDTTKNAREFTFETSPVINNNATYNRKNEPLPKTKEQIDDEIPVNRKPNNTNIGSSKVATETYAMYNKEADSMHAHNKRVLDSVMKSLNIKVPTIISPLEYIDIYLSGGGLITDNNSKVSDHISILHTGVVQREYKTKNEGLQRSQKKISRDELTKLAQYIVDMDFFTFRKEYDCADADAACLERLKKSPQPVPLELSVTVGDKKNKVKVFFYAPGDKNFVNYPSSLEKIVNAILAVVER